jgi:transcriptional regulator with XRE-family HTH domain
MRFGDILRSLLEEKNMTQKQFACELNIAPTTLGNYFRNDREPDFDTLKLLARYFNVTTDYLLDFRIGKTSARIEDEFLRIIRALSAEQQEIYLELGKAFVKINRKEKALSLPL